MYPIAVSPTQMPVGVVPPSGRRMKLPVSADVEPEPSSGAPVVSTPVVAPAVVLAAPPVVASTIPVEGSTSPVDAASVSATESTTPPQPDASQENASVYETRSEGLDIAPPNLGHFPPIPTRTHNIATTPGAAVGFAAALDETAHW
jgi:hypothetical protein